MNLIRLCVDRPVGVAVGVLLVVMFGLLSLFQLPVQLTPDLDVPILTVTTSWPGANPQEVEREIIDRQEEMLRSVRGLRKMTSKSQDNSGTVTLEFYRGIDKYQAQREINDKLGQVQGYPLEVKEPVVQLNNEEFNNIIAWLILYPGEGRDDEEIRKQRDFCEDFIKPYLDRVPGVAGVPVYGGFEREVQISIDAGQLAARGITFRQLEEALRRQNADISAGTRMQGKRDYAVRTAGQFESLDEIRNTVVASTAGGPVYVRDVADVENGYKDPEGMVRSNGQFVLAMPVRAEVSANVVAVMADVKKAIGRVNDEVLKARGMSLSLVQVYDQTIYIQQAIDMVQSNIVYGSALVLGLLLAFLRSWRATAVLALTIPVSIIGTFAVIVLLGRTLNVISLAGIAFAVGDVVDSAYVVLENIFRHRQSGKSTREAVLDGTREVWGAVLASTLTTMAVFLPVIFIQEEAGQLFRDISIAEVAAVGLSMLVAVTVIPPLATRLLERRTTAPRFPTDDAPQAEPAKGAVPTRDPVLRLASWFAGVVDGLNHHRYGRALVIAGMTIGSFLLAWPLVPESSYLPAGNQNLVFGMLFSPPGYSQGEYLRMGRVVEQGIRPYWSVKRGSPEQVEMDRKWVQQVEGMLASGMVPELMDPKLSSLEKSRARREWLTPPPLVEEFFFVSFNGMCFMGAVSQDEMRVKPLVRLFQTTGGALPGVFALFQQAQIFDLGAGGNNAEIQIRGDDLSKVVAAAQAMQMSCMGEFGGFVSADPPNYSQGRPELRIIPDRERAGELGLSVEDVGLVVEASVDGALVGEYRAMSGDAIDIALYVKGQKDRATREIAQIPLYSPNGRIVPLAAASTLLDTTALEQINRIERQRSVTLSVTPPEAMPLETVIRKIKDEIEPGLRASGQIDRSITVALTGNADKLAAARNSLVGEWKGWNLQSLVNIASGKALLSVLVVYLLMCALYESWVYPFVIMFSVPLAVFGGFLGLSLCHWGTLMTTDQPVQQLDVLTFLGFIMLSGLVVKNAILLVEQSLVFLRDHHMPIRDAVREAVRVRVRPVLMTSLTSIVGLLPLAIMPGAGSELYRGLASVILGGMFVSTIGTLVLVPIVLCAVIELRESLRGEAAAAIDGAAAAPTALRER